MPAAMAMAQQGPPMMQGGMPPQGGMPMQMPMGAMAEGGIVGYSDGGRIPDTKTVVSLRPLLTL